MNAQALPLAAVVSVLFLASCGGHGSPTAPPPPAGGGTLFFVDSGCACVNPPYPPITVFVDGRQAGLLPVFGHLSIGLAPGQHTWSLDSATAPATTVQIQTGVATTVQVMTNLSCADGCASDPNASRSRP